MPPLAFLGAIVERALGAAGDKKERRESGEIWGCRSRACS